VGRQKFLKEGGRGAHGDGPPRNRFLFETRMLREGKGYGEMRQDEEMEKKLGRAGFKRKHRERDRVDKGGSWG